MLRLTSIKHTRSASQRVRGAQYFSQGCISARAGHSVFFSGAHLDAHGVPAFLPSFPIWLINVFHGTLHMLFNQERLGSRAGHALFDPGAPGFARGFTHFLPNFPYGQTQVLHWFPIYKHFELWSMVIVIQLGNISVSSRTQFWEANYGRHCNAKLMEKLLFILVSSWWIKEKKLYIDYLWGPK